MRNDHWAKRNRQRRQRRKAREDAERRLDELKEAWRQRRMEGELEERRLERDRKGRNCKGRQG
jgi:hypothetical protein